MALENQEIDGVAVPHRVIKITGDGACLFSSISYLVHGTTSLAFQVRTDIVRHVSNNWRRLKPYTLTTNQVPYSSKYICNQFSTSESYRKPLTNAKVLMSLEGGQLIPLLNFKKTMCALSAKMIRWVRCCKMQA